MPFNKQLIELIDSHHKSKNHFHLVFFVHLKYLHNESETTSQTSQFILLSWNTFGLYGTSSWHSLHKKIGCVNLIFFWYFILDVKAFCPIFDNSITFDETSGSCFLSQLFSKLRKVEWEELGFVSVLLNINYLERWWNQNVFKFVSIISKNFF